MRSTLLRVLTKTDQSFCRATFELKHTSATCKKRFQRKFRTKENEEVVPQSYSE